LEVTLDSWVSVSFNFPSYSLQEDAVKILLGLREKYETYHKCKYTLEGINAAVYLSARYIPDRHLPDKAIDLIDEAGSRARMESFKRKKEEQCSIISKSPDEYWREIRAVQAMHDVVIEYLERAVANNFCPCPSAGRCLIDCATYFRH
jgi:ATP-dependent Clp protease ATP-binding subunit ClpA